MARDAEFWTQECLSDYIQIEENQKERTIVRLGRALPMKTLRTCGRSLASWVQLE